MSNENQEGTGFSPDYVKELRQENASWRQKVRDLESKQKINDVQVELIRKGVDVNPTWVNIADDEAPAVAVDRFLTEYPQFTTKQVEPEQRVEPKTVMPKPMNSRTPNTTNVGPEPQNKTGREIAEIKKDPKARSALRSQYRQLLAQSSNNSYEGD